MIKFDDTAVWVKCDMCGFTQFAGFNAVRDEIKSKFTREGWMFQEKMICPFCNGKADTDEWKRPYKGAFLF